MDPDYREQDGGCEASNSRGVPVFSDITVSASSPSESPPLRDMKDQETQSHLNRNRTKSRVKSSSKRMFLDTSLSDEEEAADTVKTVVGGDLHTSTNDPESRVTEDGETDCTVPQITTSENSWTCPLTLEMLAPSPGDAETQESSGPWSVSPSSGAANPQVRSKNRSGVILKLRRMLSGGLNRKKARYQAVSESGTFADPSVSQAEDRGDVSSEMVKVKVTHRWKRTGSLPHALRPLSSSSKRKHRSHMKIKYCPYLSACHSAEHRRRWVLRSAVQRARRAMRFYYPDLVGKKIRHLYEEDDKTEVWYRGEVLRIHEANTNPLKTIFEVRYDSEPEWKYYLELLMDYKKGWLKIED